MTADFCYSLIKFASSKNQGGYINPSDFNLVINQAQLSYMDFLLGQPEQFQPGRPQPRVDFGMSENVRNVLTPFIQVPTTLVIDPSGKANYPAEYQQVDAMFTTAMDRIRFVPQDALYSYINSTIDPVATNPIYLIQNVGFQFYPVSLGSALISYVRAPRTIVWTGIDNANGRPIYDQGNSQDPLWYDTDMLEITVRALRLVGINLQSQAIGQYAEQIKNQGQ